MPAQKTVNADLLRARVSGEAQNLPGVYRFTGPKGEVLYVGKSVRVRSRLLSYFRQDVPVKLRELLRVATGVEWEYVPNHFEAVVREFRQIKAFQPRFNRQHRRERRFAWIRVTDGPAPRFVASRRPPIGSGARFGPFPARGKLPAVLRELAIVAGIRDCAANTPIHFSDQADLFRATDVPRCPRADLGTCPAPCAGRCSHEEYQAGIEDATRFLEGRDDAILDAVRAKMERAAEGREFELAARLRDREERLRALRDRVVSFRDLLDGLSFVYRVPPEHGEGPTGDRGYVIVGGRVLHSFTFDRRNTWKRQVRAAIDRAAGPPTPVDGASREEGFLVARWFVHRPAERERTSTFDEIL